MATPAAAATLRASTFPNIANEVASAFEAMTAIVTLGGGDASALDTELKAIEDPVGTDVFPDGTSTTQAELEVIVRKNERHGQWFVRAVNRYVYGKL